MDLLVKLLLSLGLSISSTIILLPEIKINRRSILLKLACFIRRYLFYSAFLIIIPSI